MSSMLHFCVLFLLSSWNQVLACSEKGPCRELAFPSFLFFADRRLTKHTIKNVQVRDLADCELRCYQEHNCVSINFENKASEKGKYKCELNNSTHGEHEEDLVEAETFFYRGTVNACGKSSCKNGGTCQSGFTKKRYRCLCVSGYMGADCTHDINECEENTHECDKNAACTNKRGTYTCTCNANYSGDGYNCKGKKGSLASVPGLSCKDIKDSGDFHTSGTYWIRPVGSRDSFQGYCDMSAVGQWKKVTHAWIENTFKEGVTLIYSEKDDGLVISGQVTSKGCGGPQSGALTLIKGYWTKIKYTQEFRGVASCWSIFGDLWYGRSSVSGHSTGVHPFNASQGDSITNQHNMGGGNCAIVDPIDRIDCGWAGISKERCLQKGCCFDSSIPNTHFCFNKAAHVFDGKTTKCDNEVTNFWRYPSQSVRYATVVLRRKLTAESAGIFTGTSCGLPTYKIQNIFVHF